MIWNEPGRTLQAVWDEMPEHDQDFHTGEFVVMPNHVHGIVMTAGAAPVAALSQKHNRRNV